MRKNTWEASCVLLGLFVSLHLCSGKLMTPITDDVSKLSLLKQNIPSDYEIPVSYVTKDVASRCWVALNIYPLEQSLRRLAGMFGAISSNREHIGVFVSMLKSLRFTFDHEELEAAMQLFQCHYRERGLASGLYFDYIHDVLRAADSQGASSLLCKPPPCQDLHPSPGGQEEGRGSSWSIGAAWILVLIPFTACGVILLWLVKTGWLCPSCIVENLPLLPPGLPTVSISIPLQTLPHAGEPVQEVVPEHESG